MIEYLIRSGLVLTILLAIYHLWLEKEKMQWFNRFYLMASMGLGLTIPLIKITLPGKDLVHTQLQLSEFVLPNISTMVPTEINRVAVPQHIDIITLVYGLVAAVLLARFAINLILLMSIVYKSPKRNTPEGTIVLIKEKLAPHSFLFYIFLNEVDYLDQRIEQEIITHEFTHVRQRHSADLLFMELLISIFWFNPVFIFYKKAIQLNHEFLADEAVIESSCNISIYQQLLLQKATLKSVRVASNFNFSVTKKRFKMMKKQTSKTWKMVKAVSLLPVAAVLILAFGDIVFAQGTSAATELRMVSDNIGQLTKDEYYKGAYMRFIDNAGVKIRKRYEQLTAEEKSHYPAPVQPTEALMVSWKNAQKFVVLIGYEKPREPLANYKAKDFISYYSLKSETDELTYVYLINKDFLEKIKQLGGDFNREGNDIFLAPPPPVIMPPKEN
ncbi:M56 family metallopeptidase [Daejeonella sp.]|uniref:M56 family metallopeptidase n=1 Tax=Daejeonella sp. TaxID=2805397 RepID=UPI0039833D05